MDYKDAFLKLLKHPLTVILFAGLVVAVLYHTMSPYQNCVRTFSVDENRFATAEKNLNRNKPIILKCLERTSW